MKIAAYFTIVPITIILLTLLSSNIFADWSEYQDEITWLIYLTTILSTMPSFMLFYILKKYEEGSFLRLLYLLNGLLLLFSFSMQIQYKENLLENLRYWSIFTSVVLFMFLVAKSVMVFYIYNKKLKFYFSFLVISDWVIIISAIILSFSFTSIGDLKYQDLYHYAIEIILPILGEVILIFVFLRISTLPKEDENESLIQNEDDLLNPNEFN